MMIPYQYALRRRMIGMAGSSCDVSLSGSFGSGVQQCSVTIGGTVYTASATLSVKRGTEAIVSLPTTASTEIIKDGITVKVGNSAQTYTFNIDSNTDFVMQYLTFISATCTITTT